MPASGGCLYECLKEAHLESYYNSFVRHGIVKCEGLATLSMHEYSRFGVLSMEDRVRLFKLVQIVKSVLADGLHCQHEHPALRANYGRSQLTADAHARTISELTRMQKQRNNINLVTKQGHPKAAVRTKVSQVHTQNKVQYNPGSDTPVFKCRKTLTFSDSEDEEVEDVKKDKSEPIGPKSVAVATVKQTAVQSRNTQLDAKPERNNSKVNRDLPQVQQQKPVSPRCRPPQVFYVDLESTHPATKTPETQVERQIDISDIVDMDDKNDSGNNSASTQNRTASSTGRGTNVLSDRLGSRNISFELNQSDLSNYSTDSAGRRRPSSESGLYSRSISSRSRSASPPKPCTSQNSYELADDNYTNDHREMPSDLHDFSGTSVKNEENQTKSRDSPRERSPPRPISAFFVDAVSQKEHAYFPKFQPPKKIETRVETVVHNAEYNYGVPGLESSPKTNKRAGSVNFTSPERRSANRKSALATRNRDARIRVCVRKRPLLKKETKRQEVDIVTTQDSDAVVVEESKVTIDLSKYIQKHVFVFDEVFDSRCSNHDVYEGTAKPLVQHVIQGGCGTCFAFGQTGAGKTYSLLGDKATPGLYQLAAKDIFCSMGTGLWNGEVHLWLSYYEIYCGQLYDLLNKRKRLTVRENGKQKVCIAGLMETEVKNFNNLIHAVEYGNNVRSIGNTGVNPKSSRSHAVLTLEVRNQQDHLMGKLSFIDLAGSERASDITEFNKQTRIEGAEINQSLLALKECIRSLDQQEQHTPYRQSKLTHILRDSFLGNSKTCMIANISPILSACENTLNTLRYADRVKELRREQENCCGSIAQVPEKKNRVLNLVEVGPSLFHPSTIQGSSTPKKKSMVPQPDKSFDVNKALHDAYESPIRGHKLHKLSNKRRAESTMRGVELSPHKNSGSPSSHDNSSGRSRSNSANRSHDSKANNQHTEGIIRAASQENIHSSRELHSRENSNERPNFASTYPGSSKTPNNTNVVMPSSAGRWSHGPHMDSHFSSVTDVLPNTNDRHSATQRKIRKEDILQEHRHILSHLDDIMLRARAAMTKSTAINKQIGDIDCHQQISKQHSGVDTAALQHPYISQSNYQNIPKSAQNDIQMQKSPDQGRDRENLKLDHPSMIGLQRSQERPQVAATSKQSPMADQLFLAQVRINKQQELLEIQERQIRAMSQASTLEPTFAEDSIVGHFITSSELQSNEEDMDSRMMDERIVENGLEPNSSSESIGKSPKIHPDDRKPKLSGGALSKLVQKNYDVVLPGGNQEINNTASPNGNGLTKEEEHEKSLPTAEDFLKSLAEMKLNKQLTSDEGAEATTKSNMKLNPQQLAQLGEHFKRLGIDTRPFQDLLGSPSNTRGGKPTAFQPVQPKSEVRKQLSFPEKCEKVSEQRRVSADGEEADSLARPLPKQIVTGNEKYPTAVVVPTPTERESRQLTGQNSNINQTAVQRKINTGATSQAAVSLSNDCHEKGGTASFTPIEPHPVTTQIGNKVSNVVEENTRGNKERRETVNPVSLSPTFKKEEKESLKLNLADLSDVDVPEHSERPKSGREHVRDKTLGERGGRLDGLNTARGRIEGFVTLKESSKERARQQLIIAHEDQLAEITNLCKHEMKLLMGVKMGDQSFDEYIRVLRNVLSSKAHCVASLSSQIQQLENLSPTGSPHTANP